MASTFVSPHVIVGFKQGKSADPAVFQILLQTLRRLRYRITSEQSELHTLLPIWEKWAWRPASRSMPGQYINGRYKVSASEIVHEGIHALVTAKYGTQLKGRPHLLLLTEALASCMNVYFDLLMIAQERNSKSAQQALRRFVFCARRAKVPAATKRINRAVSEPFETFRHAVRDMYGVYLHILVEEGRGNVSSATKAKEAYAYLMSRETTMFLLSFDLGLNVLFAKANCGLVSSLQDRAMCAEILRELDSAQNMEQFLRQFLE